MLLSKNDLLAVFRCKKSKLDNMRREDPTFPKPFKVAGMLRWDETEVKRYIQEQRHGSHI